jgi:transcriptional regulator with XRE-family HTH domain
MDRKGNIPVDGKKIRALREARGLSREAFAEMVKIPGKSEFSPRRIADIETQAFPAVNPRTFKAILEALDVTPKDITPEDPNDLGDVRDAKCCLIDGSDESQRLLEASFPLYEGLFPDERERDDPDDIKTWLAESRLAARTGTPWRELYAVLHLAGKVIGMAYLSGHVRLEWVFGNYFGVRAGWRSDRASERFLDDIADALATQIPGARGIIFEVDPIHVDLLQSVTARAKLGGHNDHDQIAASLRAAKRLFFYEHYSCLTVVDRGGSPLRYRQPAMNEGQSRKDERELHLMVYLFDFELRESIVHGKTASAPLVESMINFSYDTLYQDAYGRESSTRRQRFEDNLARVKSQVLNLCEGSSLAQWHLTPANRKLINGLLAHARDEGWGDQLDL